MTNKMQMEWQTIVSAPKDGNEILVNSPFHNDDGEIVATETSIARWDNSVNAWLDQYENGFHVQPTKWRFLPKPPEEA